MKAEVDQSPWLRDGDEKRRSVQQIFSDIAPTYDLVNSLLCFRQHYRWRAKAVKSLQLKTGDAVLDVCSGTGDFLIPLRKAVGPQAHVLGLDFCAPMLDIARKKGVPADLGVADACALPVASDKFDGVTVGWGLRNVPSIELALKEILRVLRTKGRFVSVDMSRPKGIVGSVSESVCHTVAPILGSLFGKRTAYTYLPKSTLRFLSPEETAKLMTDLGFVNVWHKTLFFGNIGMVGGEKP